VRLEVTDLTVAYGAATVLEGAAFRVESAEMVVMAGPNGAGKSTAMKAVTGMAEEMGGTVLSGQMRIVDAALGHVFDLRSGARRPTTEQMVGMGIGIMAEGRRLFPTMTVRENLELPLLERANARQRAEAIDKVVAQQRWLEERLRQKAGTLSAGEQQLLCLARTLVRMPLLVLADEPSNGLSPMMADRVFEELQAVRATGVGVLVIEQNSALVLSTCERAYFFQVGRISAEATGAQLRERPQEFLEYMEE
jgi:branched-chain amino acid transport system ATP-binding protein